MPSVLDRAALEGSPLADLHLLANEIGVDGFRRLRKAELIDAILTRQGAEGDAAATAEDEPSDDEQPRRSRSRRTRSRSRDAEAAAGEDAKDDAAPSEDGGRRSTAEAEKAAAAAGEEEESEDELAGRRRRRSRRGEEQEDRAVEGVVELQPNGSAFVRVNHPETSDDDVYVSAAQVKRCELVSGDRVGGPVRAPRRSERFPSLVRVDTINGKPADEVAEGTRFEDMPVAFPSERLELGSDDPTVTAIEWLTPIGKGSRVTVTGPSRAGKTEALRRIAAALAGREGLEVTVALAGARPEEVGEWSDPAPAAAATFAASPDAQTQAVEQVVEQARRVAARGGDAVVIVDSLEYLPAPAARRVLAAARNLAEAGSLTILAAAPAPVGGETTVVALDAQMTALGRFPALDLTASGTLRPELLVGEAGAEKIARARAEAAA